MARVLSVNVGRPREAAWTTIGRTAIDKTPVRGAVAVHELGLEGDQVANLRHHGGRDKAVHAFAREDLDRWAGRLGADIADGQFGENLTTQGVDVNAAVMGERWRVGGAEGPVLEVAGFRTPCAVFQAWMGRSGYDARAWVRRFADDARPGAYLRVVVPGVLVAGDEVEVVAPGHGPTVTEAFLDVFGR